jgi:hypothetical protein
LHRRGVGRIGEVSGNARRKSRDNGYIGRLAEEAIFTTLAIAQKSIGRTVPIVKMPQGGASYMNGAAASLCTELEVDPSRLRRPDTVTAMTPKEFKRGH